MSNLKKRVCNIIKDAGFGDAEINDIILNRHRSHSAEGFYIKTNQRDYFSIYTLTEFVKTFRRCGDPSLSGRSELYFENDSDGRDCRHFGYAGAGL